MVAGLFVCSSIIFLKHARDYPLALLGHHEEGIKGSFYSPDQLHAIMKVNSPKRLFQLSFFYS